MTGYDVDGYFAKLVKRLWHIHLRDATASDTVDCPQKLERTHGNGIVDFKKFGETLGHANYKGDVSLEFEYRDMPLDAIEREFNHGIP